MPVSLSRGAPYSSNVGGGSCGLVWVLARESLMKHCKKLSLSRVGYVQSSSGLRWTMALRISLVVRMPTK